MAVKYEDYIYNPLSNIAECYLYMGNKEKCLEYLNLSKNHIENSKILKKCGIHESFLCIVYGEYYIENVIFIL